MSNSVAQVLMEERCDYIAEVDQYDEIAPDLEPAPHTLGPSVEVTKAAPAASSTVMKPIPVMNPLKRPCAEKRDDPIVPLKESLMREVIESLSMAEKAARHRASSSTGEANILASIRSDLWTKLRGNRTSSTVINFGKGKMPQTPG